MMGRGAAARHPFAALSSHMLFFVFGSTLDFALLWISLFFVVCSALYFARPYILYCICAIPILLCSLICSDFILGIRS